VSNCVRKFELLEKFMGKNQLNINLVSTIVIQ